MIDALAADLEAGRTTARALVEECLARIEDPSGEGVRTFLRVDPGLARAEAEHADRLREAGATSPYAGIPISTKDLFDLAGQRSLAGSKVLADAPVATRDATAIARLKAAGFLVIGRTNMTEFAFSGVGLNPHYGTPRNPWDRATGRIPGGSSSGAAVSVTDGMAVAGIGTDTGGSCRIPAALCGIVGYKPTSRRIPRDGAVPLSTTLDSIGPLARTVRDCAILDAIMAGEPVAPAVAAAMRGLRLLAPTTLVLDGVDGDVAGAYQAALRRLGDAGALITEAKLPILDELGGINGKGGFSAAEAYAFHRPYIARSPELYDPRVLVRLQRGREQEAADYIDLIAARADAIARLDAITADYDAMVMPTTPLAAPPISALDADDDYARINMMMLRNTGVGNFFDRCAISIPCHPPGTIPVGLMLVGPTGGDARLFAIAAAAEAALAH
jgi:aspartyl-tRNA(Asn)/glutamyl-tRNA(Gln) amidotransferase subunit A